MSQLPDYEPLLIFTAILAAIIAVGYAVYGIALGVWWLGKWVVGLFAFLVGW